MLSQSKQIAMYDWAGNSADAWAGSAESLLAAARILRDAFDAARTVPLQVGDSVPDGERARPSEIMLRGFALECLLKALWVKRGNQLASKGKFQNIAGVGNHELPQLAQKLGFTCTPAEKDILKRLSLFMTAVGRYPIPTHWSKTKIQTAFGGGKGSPTYWQSPSDDSAYTSIVTRLEAELDN